MTKSFTLENVLTQQSSQNKSGKSIRIPSNESVNMIVRYSMALEVIRTQHSGNCFLIKN
ncbi:MAG: hypothetical protein HXX13_01060 [Bacteroidetes bacterium]|nr:hypothetical protein [Bacteroidota bacterium]